MTQVKIVTDSSAYLPKELVARYDIEVLPITLNWGDARLRDGVDITPDEFYKRLDGSSVLPTTSQFTNFEYETAFRRLLEETGKDILVLPISQGLSGSHFGAVKAREDVDPKRIEVVDTKLTSMALGFMVLAAARAAEAGKTLAECKKAAEDTYEHIGVYFTVRTLKYLAAGGRINTAKKLMGTLLDVKPVLMLRDGKIELVESVRSTKKAIRRMVELVEKDIAGRKPVRISVFHAGVPQEAAELQAELEAKFGAVEGIISEISPVVGSHVGTGTIAVAFQAGEPK